MVTYFFQTFCTQTPRQMQSKRPQPAKLTRVWFINVQEYFFHIFKEVSALQPTYYEPRCICVGENYLQVVTAGAIKNTDKHHILVDTAGTNPALERYTQHKRSYKYRQSQLHTNMGF